MICVPSQEFGPDIIANCPTAEQFLRSAMPTLGWAQRTCGHWSHSLMVKNSKFKTWWKEANTRHAIRCLTNWGLCSLRSLDLSWIQIRQTTPERCQPDKFANLSFSAFLVVCLFLVLVTFSQNVTKHRQSTLLYHWVTHDHVTEVRSLDNQKPP